MCKYIVIFQSLKNPHHTGKDSYLPTPSIKNYQGSSDTYHIEFRAREIDH